MAQTSTCVYASQSRAFWTLNLTAKHSYVKATCEFWILEANRSYCVTYARVLLYFKLLYCCSAFSIELSPFKVRCEIWKDLVVNLLLSSTVKLEIGQYLPKLWVANFIRVSVCWQHDNGIAFFSVCPSVYPSNADTGTVSKILTARYIHHSSFRTLLQSSAVTPSLWTLNTRGRKTRFWLNTPFIS